MIRVAIADDQELIRVGLRTLLTGERDIEFAGEASDGLAAVSLAQSTHPDVMLMDIRMPGIDGIEATRRLAGTSTRIIVVTTFEVDEYVFDALRAGASGFLLKDTPPAALIDAIRVVAAGEALLSPSVTRTLIDRFTAPAPVAKNPLLEQLTDRELEIVRLVGQGLSNDEIAERLVISPATARTHVGRAMVKLGARDRAQVVVIAYRSGLVSPS